MLFKAPPRSLLWAYAALALVCYLMYFMLFNGHKCDMRENLVPVINVFADTAEKFGIKYYFDDGSLLGVWRDGGVIPFDFDIDLAIFESDYQKLYGMKEYFAKQYGFTLYGLDDYIWTKAWQRVYAFEWNPYLNPAPCLRLYDQNMWIYADIYCDKLVDKETMLRSTQWPPQGYDLEENKNKKYFCNNEPDRGCCRFEEWITPLKEHNSLGRTIFVPNQVEKVLSHIYGENGWQVPKAKGVKIMLCSFWGWWLIFFVFSALIISLIQFIRRANSGR